MRWIACALAFALATSSARAETPPSVPLPTRSISPGPLLERLDPASTGITLVHEFPANAPLTLLQEQGAGAGICAGDIDGDGLPDLFFSNYQRGSRLYKNLGNWKFLDVTERAGISTQDRWCAGVTFVDIDGDGDLDLYICCFDAPNLLFINRGDGTFEESAARRGIAWNGASVMASFADMDRDGRLDLYVLTHRDSLHREQRLPTSTTDATTRGLLRRGAGGAPEVPSEFKELFELVGKGEGRVELAIAGQADQLFRQLPDGTFTNITQSARIAGNDIGLGCSWWDYNADGWPDLYVANDHKTPDRLWRNNRDGTFTDVASTVLPHVPLSSMGTDIADVNNDGLMDLLATDMAASRRSRRLLLENHQERNQWFLETSRPRQVPRNALFLGTGTEWPREVAALVGVEATDWTWSPKFADFDNDGRIDLFIANGMARDFLHGDRIARQRQPGAGTWRTEPLLRERHLAFRNRGGLKFEPIEQSWGLDATAASFGACIADFDRDGTPDLVVMNLGESPTLFRNREATYHRVVLRLKGIHGNTWGIGAVVTAEFPSETQTRCLALTSGFMSANEPLVHFGLGTESHIPRLRVRWPSGLTQTFESLPADRRYTIEEPTSDSSKPALAFENQTDSLLRATTVFDQLAHREVPFDDYAREPLLPWKVSAMGPSVAVGDVDGDGLDDIYLAAAAGFNGMLARQTSAHTFASQSIASVSTDAQTDETGALFLDVDGDGDLDLYTVRGGVRTGPNATALQDQLLLNDGRGNFRPAPPGSLPSERDAGSVVCAADLDRDGDLDLFVGGRSVPGHYPLPAQSHLLRNLGGTFEESRDASTGFLSTLGIVTAALWSDVNQDGWPDLLVCEEWGRVRCFLNDHGRLAEATRELGFGTHTGLWQSIAAIDFNGDGALDYITGNFGSNFPRRASREFPWRLARGDFFSLGITNLLEITFEDSRWGPTRGRRALLNAFPPLAEAFPTFESMAQASLEQMFPKLASETEHEVSVDTLATGVWIQRNGTFHFEPLPPIAQLAPTFGIVPIDLDADGIPEIALAQNFHPMHPELGRLDGSIGVILTQRPSTRGSVEVMPVPMSGFSAPVDARALVRMDLNGDGFADLALAARNQVMAAFESTLGQTNGRITPLRARLKGKRGNPTAIGARMEVWGDGTRIDVQELSASSGSQGQSSSTLFMPRQKRRGPMEVRVRWPEGNWTTNAMPKGALEWDLKQP